MIKDRYHRHSLIDWFSQEEVNDSNFAIVGCGAVGNEVAKNLTLLGVGKLDLFDFDKIEIHNLTRSVLFRETDIGRYKSEVVAERLKDLEPNIQARAFTNDFWEEMTFAMLEAYSGVICCVDNFEARIRLNQLCSLSRTNLINTGIDSKFAQIDIFPFSSDSDIPCYECGLPPSVYSRIRERYSCGWLKKVAYVEKKIPTTIITSAVAGAMAANFALELLRSEEKLTSRRILIDSKTGQSSSSVFHKNDVCPACSDLKNKISIFEGKALIGEKPVFLEYPDDAVVITSDPILVSRSCPNCDSEKEEIIFRRASDFDSSLARCEKCGNESINVDIKDSFSLGDLYARFKGYNIPSKFIRFDSNEKTVIVELIK